MQILVIGDNCVDITIKGNFQFERDKNIVPEDIKITPAGTGVNFSCALSNLGCEVFYFTPLGNDIFSHIIERHLDSFKVRKDFIDRVNKKTALIVAIVNEEGERTTFAGIKDVAYEEIDTKKLKEIDFSNFLAVYISGGILTGKTSQKRLREVVDFISKKRLRLFFDTQIRIGEEIEGFIDAVYYIMKRSNVIFSNLREFSLIEDEFKYKLIDEGKVFVIKMGENGAMVITGKEKIVSSGIPVRSVDTTGAGDIFNASFVYKYLESGSLKEAVGFANSSGALSTTKLGVYIPSKEEIYDFMKRKEEGC